MSRGDVFICGYLNITIYYITIQKKYIYTYIIQNYKRILLSFILIFSDICTIIQHTYYLCTIIKYILPI